MNLLNIIMIACVLCFSSNFAFCFQNEPDNFRGMKWGANIKELPDMIIYQDHGASKYYKKNNDEMKIGEADLKSIVYSFDENRFRAVLIEFSGRSNLSLIKKTLFQLYGNVCLSYKNGGFESFIWQGEFIIVSLNYGEEIQGHIFYNYKPIADKSTKVKEEKVNPDCWDFGAKFGYCGTLAFHGFSCRPEDDVVIPVECRNMPETKLGIRSGTERAYDKLGLPKK